MPGDHDRDQQDADRDGEQAAHPGLTWLTKGGESDSDHQDDQQQGAEVETKAPHGMVPNKVTDFILPIMFPKIDSLFLEGGSQAYRTHRDVGFSGPPLFSVIDWTERWLAREMMLTGVTSNPTPTCPKSRNSSGKRSRRGRFVSVPILMAVFASCQFDSLKSETPAHPVPRCDQPITRSGSEQ